MKEAQIYPVLDKGYVRLARTNLCAPIMGDDLSVVNAARASYMKESNELTERDIRLIRYLAKHLHTSPFRHATVTMEVKAPLMIARQWFKYRVGWEHGPDTAELVGVCVPEHLAAPFWEFMRKAIQWIPQGDDHGFNDPLYGRNEASRRYITIEPEFYVPAPHEWRSKPENSKQGSGDPLDEEVGRILTEKLKRKIEQGIKDFEEALDLGVAPEQARGFIDCAYFMYTVWRWTSSLQGVTHFLNQRLSHDAQDEITQYAKAVWMILRQYFEYSFKYLINEEVIK